MTIDAEQQSPAEIARRDLCRAVLESQHRVNAFFALPPAICLAGLAVLGLVLGSLVNWAIYALAWHSRPISPWQRPHPKAPPRQLVRLSAGRRLAGPGPRVQIHGRGFWIRPLLIELACGDRLAGACTGGKSTWHLAPTSP